MGNAMKRFAVLGLAVLALNACERKADNDDGAVIELAQPVEYTAEEKAALLAAMPAPFNAADLADGEKQFAKCRSCHTITADKMNLTGPHLYGLFGRKSGTEPGYTFSKAMTDHNVVWDFTTLDTFVAAPQATVKGTKMGFAGIADAEHRRNLIAYLKVEGTPRAEPAPAASKSASASE
jgi:cytochrome c